MSIESKRGGREKKKEEKRVFITLEKLISLLALL